MWPISNTQTFVGFFTSNGLTQSTCEPLAADFQTFDTNPCEGHTVNFADISDGVPITWEWTFEGGTPATSMEENPNVTYDEAGTYDVTLTVHDGVFTTTTTMEDYITVHDCTGIPDLANSINIYPNPAEDVIHLTSATVLTNVQIVNNIGQIVLERNVNGNEYQIKTSDLEAGLYFILLETENTVIQKKLVIK